MWVYLTSYKCTTQVNGTSTYKSHYRKCHKYSNNICKDIGPKQSQLNFQSSVNEKGEHDVSKKN